MRRFAQQSARTSADTLKLPALSAALQDFDFIAPASARAAALERIARAAPAPTAPLAAHHGDLLLPDGRADQAALSRLRAQADATAINIGE